MNEYTLSIFGKEFRISNPDECEFCEIDTTSEVFSDHEISKHKFPNGAIVEYTKYSDRIIIKTNCELVQDDDGINYSLVLR